MTVDVLAKSLRDDCAYRRSLDDEYVDCVKISYLEAMIGDRERLLTEVSGLRGELDSAKAETRRLLKKTERLEAERGRLLGRLEKAGCPHGGNGEACIPEPAVTLDDIAEAEKWLRRIRGKIKKNPGTA